MTSRPNPLLLPGRDDRPGDQRDNKREHGFLPETPSRRKVCSGYAILTFLTTQLRPR
jgi:hypothetical protein